MYFLHSILQRGVSSQMTINIQCPRYISFLCDPFDSHGAAEGVSGAKDGEMSCLDYPVSWICNCTA